MKENIIPIKLFEREFVIKTYDSPQKIKEVTDFLNEYLENIQKEKVFKDRLNLSLLATFNMAIEYMDLKKEFTCLSEETKNRVTYLVNLIDEFWAKVSCEVRD